MGFIRAGEREWRPNHLAGGLHNLVEPRQGGADGVEAGQEDIYPDPFAVDFGRQFGSSPKASERQVAAMAAAMLSGAAA